MHCYVSTVFLWNTASQMCEISRKSAFRVAPRIGMQNCHFYPRPNPITLFPVCFSILYIPYSSIVTLNHCFSFIPQVLISLKAYDFSFLSRHLLLKTLDKYQIKSCCHGTFSCTERNLTSPDHISPCHSDSVNVSTGFLQDACGFHYLDAVMWHIRFFPPCSL